MALSRVAGSGGRDRVTALLHELGEPLGIRDHAVWDANQLSTYLNAYPDVAALFADAITSGDVLSQLMTLIDHLRAASSESHTVG